MAFENQPDVCLLFFNFWGVCFFIFGLLTEIKWITLDFTKMLMGLCVCIQLVQVIINTTHLEQSCHYLEEFISNITNVPPHTVNATKLYGTSTFKVLLRACISQIYVYIYIVVCIDMCVSIYSICIFHYSTHASAVWCVLFQDARHSAEAEIYTSLNAKIDQFLQLADYDWLVSAQGDNGEASDYLIDLIAFLKSTFSVFTNLPVSPRRHTCAIPQICRSHCADLFTCLFLLVADLVKSFLKV